MQDANLAKTHEVFLLQKSNRNELFPQTVTPTYTQSLEKSIAYLLPKAESE